MVTLNHALEIVMQLSLEQREMLVEIMQNRNIENHRNDIAKAAKEARTALQAGRLKPQPVEQIIARLRQSLNES